MRVSKTEFWMEKDMVFILREFLAVNNHRIKEDALSLELISHPDFPSMKSITDTLSFFKVKNLAVQLSEQAFDQIDQPVLANTMVNGQSQMVLVLSHNTQTIEVCMGSSTRHRFSMAKSAFVDIWTGEIVAIDESKEKQPRELPKELALVVVLILGPVLRFTQQPFSAIDVVFTSLGLMGLVITYLIHTISMNGEAGTGRYCFLGKKTDCSKVIQSGKTLPFLDWGLSDLGLIYFASLYFLLVVNVSFESFALLSLLALLVVIYSWYQQAFVVKKACSLCLVLSLILIGQASLYALVKPSFSDYTSDHTLILFALVLTSTLWYYLKPGFNLENSTSGIKQELRAFKRNYHLFLPYYRSVPQLDVSLNVPDIKLGGNPRAPIQILGITNPLCDACFDTHLMYEKLLEKYKDVINVNLRFYVPVEDLNDPRTQVAACMINASIQKSRDDFNCLMADWYQFRDIKKWSKIYQLTPPGVNSIEVLKAHKKWCHTHNIETTPSILVNGRRFPLFYHPTDLENFIEELIDLESKIRPTQMCQPLLRVES